MLVLQDISPKPHILGVRVTESTSLVVIHHWKAEYLQITKLLDNIACIWCQKSSGTFHRSTQQQKIAFYTFRSIE